MTKIPKILFHGTTLLRYALIRRSGKMDAFTPKHYKKDRREITGYLYFTDNVEEAAGLGLVTLLTDLRMNHEEFKYTGIYRDVGLSEDPRDSIVVAVRTSNIRENFELDPEMETYRKPLHRVMSQIDDKFEPYQSTWYRHKGDVATKYLYSYRISPFKNIPKIMIDHLNYGIDFNEIKDLGYSGPELALIHTKAEIIQLDAHVRLFNKCFPNLNNSEITEEVSA